MTVQWGASTDNVGVAGYTVYLNGTSVTTTSVDELQRHRPGLWHQLPGRRRCVRRRRQPSPTATITAATAGCQDTTPPTTPSNLTQSGGSQASVTVQWGASTDNVGVAGYTVYLNGTSVTTTTSTTYSITGLVCGTNYQVGVDAFDAAGNHSPTATITATTAGCQDTTPPSTPSNLTQSGGSQASVTVQWGASTDNVGVAGYTVYLNGTSVTTTTSTTYTITGLVCGTNYQVGVDAFDAAGNHSPTATITATTAGCQDTTPPSTPSNLTQSGGSQASVTVQWGASTDNVGVAGYTVYLNGTSVTTTTSTTYTITGLACGTNYQVAVDAFDAAGNHSPTAMLTATTAACHDTIPPSVPSNAAQTAGTQSSVSLRWGAATDAIDGVSGYTVYLNGAVETSTTQTSVTIGGLICGTTYPVGVDAVDTSGNHSAQATVSATTANARSGRSSSTPSACPVPGGIPLGSDGNLWFSLERAAPS